MKLNKRAFLILSAGSATALGAMTGNLAASSEIEERINAFTGATGCP